MLQVSGSRLQVCQNYTTRDDIREKLSKCRLILLQHLMRDTQDFIRLLEEAGAEIFAVVAKPYSIDPNVLEALKGKGYHLTLESYQVLENSLILDNLLEQAVARCAIDDKEIIILEVGGYFARPLTRLHPRYRRYIKGVVEVTTFGHNRYKKLIEQLELSVYSVARSPIKAIEARFVGQAAVVAIDQVLRQAGIALAGRQALVLGFGMIGRNLAEALHNQHMVVSVYDKLGLARLDAFTQGYNLSTREALLAKADLICSATAVQALAVEDMELLKDNAILVSAGSQGNEFDVVGLKRVASRRTEISQHLVQYQLPGGKQLILMHEGTAVNFIINSCPDEVVDLIFAEELICTLCLLDTSSHPVQGVINETPEADLHKIAGDWLALTQNLGSR